MELDLENQTVEAKAIEMVQLEMASATQADGLSVHSEEDASSQATPSKPSTASSLRPSRMANQKMFADKDVPRIRPVRRRERSEFSRAFLKQPFYLYSNRAQIFFENNYERVNMSLVASTLICEAVGGTDLAVKISAILNEAFSSLETKLMNAIAELQKVAEENKVPPELQVSSYDHKRHYEPPLHTPQSSLFLTVVSLFDRLVARADAAWINRLITTQMRQKIVSSWEKELSAFVRELFKIQKTSREEARNAGFGRRVASLEAQNRRSMGSTPLTKDDVVTTEHDSTPEASAKAK